MSDSELAKIAAVAESAATTRWREEPKTAKATRGSKTGEAGDDRRLRDPGIAEDLGNVHRRQRQPGDGVAQRLPRLDRQEASKDRKTHILGALPSRGGHRRREAGCAQAQGKRRAPDAILASDERARSA